MSEMSSNRPYLIRALYEWIVDNGFTPHVAVQTDRPDVRIPPGYGKDGQIVLNISPTAAQTLHMDNAALSFQARFGGAPHNLYIPVGAVIAIYARENGEGMAFDPEPPVLANTKPDDELPPTPNTPPSGAKRPALKVVK